MKLTFCGGAKSVTGANYLLELENPRSSASNPRKSAILVDCGLQQGGYFAEKQNFDSFCYNPSEIGAVFITHAHIDHIGRLPKLVKDGFHREVYSTPATRDFAELMLLDSENILNKEAAREGKPPLYSDDDVSKLMSRWKGIEYRRPFEFGAFKIEFFDAGHILGSAFIKIEAENKTIVFSGDLGNSPAPIIRPTEKIESADYCLIESTYGNRFHETVSKRREMLEDAIEDTVKAGGVLMIPAFAMERTQDLLYHLHQLFEEGRIPRVPVFIDSPLAIKVTAVYKKHKGYFNQEVLKTKHAGEDILNFPGLRLALTTEQSKEINNVPAPKIILAGSGMSHGGRILHHESRYLSDSKNMILFVGYQARGSLGERIRSGAKNVRIFGEDVSVRCRVGEISAYSAHADQAQLLEWLAPMQSSLKKVFVVQGEPDASEALRQRITETMRLDAVVPEAGESVVL
ncbi:MAG: MBL fold metallo-hydrolase [Candidatus Liptonbacteria bacterium]|nr:MBL fold metallo-hydrolase [Candidatus Liptonbacteria bacterium]